MSVNGKKKEFSWWMLLFWGVLAAVLIAIGYNIPRGDSKPSEQQTLQVDLVPPTQPAEAAPAAEVEQPADTKPAAAPADAAEDEKQVEEKPAPPSTSKPALAANTGSANTERAAMPVTDSPARTASVQSSAPNGTLFRWKHVGADPCNPKAGCTLSWALAQIGWPTSVKDELMTKVTQDVSQVYTMATGWNGWMTWGQHSPKFRANTLADWGAGHTETASLWQVSYGNQVYNLVKVGRCGNWGGWIEIGPVSLPTQDSRMPLSVLPTGSCVPNSIAGQ